MENGLLTDTFSEKKRVTKDVLGVNFTFDRWDSTSETKLFVEALKSKSCHKSAVIIKR